MNASPMPIVRVLMSSLSGVPPHRRPAERAHRVQRRGEAPRRECRGAASSCVAGTRVGHEGQRDDAAVVDPAEARAAVVPDLVEAGDCTDAHQDVPAVSASSISTLSITTSRARSAATSMSTTASTVAPSAIVPSDASTKCSRKCSGVKCESAPNRTLTCVTRSRALVGGDLFDLAHHVAHQRVLVHRASSFNKLVRSASTASAACRTAASTGGESDSPPPKPAPSIP